MSSIYVDETNVWKFNKFILMLQSNTKHYTEMNIAELIYYAIQLILNC